MRLDHVRIKNFRSIEELKIGFEPQCRILVGMTEAGKSNILRAFSLLSKSSQITKDDIRQSRPEEDSIKESHIFFVFKLTEDERLQLIQKFNLKVLNGSEEDNFISGGKPQSLAQFLNSFEEGLYRVNLITNTKDGSYWALTGDQKIAKHWKAPSNACPPDFLVPGTQVLLRKLHLVNTKMFPNIPSTYLEDPDIETIHGQYGKLIIEHIAANLPECIYWTYDEKYLLPVQLNLAQFGANPNSCVPLKHMFELAGVTDIPKTLAEARSRNHGVRNLLKKVAERTTDHIRKVWKEHDNIKVDLSPNSDNVDASILDSFNHYEFSKRSDGFKRFVSFLILISSRVKTGGLANGLIIIDEPEIGLHPSGARFLRDELIRISGANCVIFSTHSVFMIDRNRIDRHLIIQKKKEITTAEAVSESNFSEEEVLFNALGTSLFETLKDQNIVFEGWRDKRLFETALKVLAKRSKAQHKQFDSTGYSFANGTKDLRIISTLLELARRECVIVSDNDDAALNAKREHEKSNGYGRWYTYNDLVPNFKITTGEDFISPEAVKRALDHISLTHGPFPEFTPDAVSGPHGRLESMRKWFGRAGVKDVSEVIKAFKKQLFEDLRSDDILPVYFEFLDGLVAILKKPASDAKV